MTDIIFDDNFKIVLTDNKLYCCETPNKVPGYDQNNYDLVEYTKTNGKITCTEIKPCKTINTSANINYVCTDYIEFKNNYTQIKIENKNINIFKKIFGITTDNNDVIKNLQIIQDDFIYDIMINDDYVVQDPAGTAVGHRPIKGNGDGLSGLIYTEYVSNLILIANGRDELMDVGDNPLDDDKKDELKKHYNKIQDKINEIQIIPNILKTESVENKNGLNIIHTYGQNFIEYSPITNCIIQAFSDLYKSYCSAIKVYQNKFLKKKLVLTFIGGKIFAGELIDTQLDHLHPSYTLYAIYLAMIKMNVTYEIYLHCFPDGSEKCTLTTTILENLKKIKNVHFD